MARKLKGQTRLRLLRSPWAAQDTSLREILNAIFYIVRSGCAWRLLPHEFPPWKTIHHYFRTWRLNGTWKRLHAALRERVRVRMGRDPQPRALCSLIEPSAYVSVERLDRKVSSDGENPYPTSRRNTGSIISINALVPAWSIASRSRAPAWEESSEDTMAARR
ncbi:MAG: hypothetical protein CYG60_13775 [Actinobacteria bacterium]|nr:MAG: hypothetical protein CYG60_13775 [Actinomycetota bacterium]